MFLPPPPDNCATERIYQSDLDGNGFVMNLSRLWARRPDIYAAFVELRSLLTGRSSLTQRELAVLVCATAAAAAGSAASATAARLGDSYCALAWGKRLADAADPAAAAAVLRAADGPGLTARDRALADWARKLVARPNETTRDDVDGLRLAGLSDQEIFEATTFIAFRLAFSTVNDALGARPDWQLAAAAPPEVRQAVNFGRPTAEPAPPG
jgi:uncharacterized peroxidase-related enzyme